MKRIFLVYSKLELITGEDGGIMTATLIEIVIVKIDIDTEIAKEIETKRKIVTERKIANVTKRKIAIAKKRKTEIKIANVTERKIAKKRKIANVTEKKIARKTARKIGIVKIDTVIGIVTEIKIGIAKIDTVTEIETEIGKEIKIMIETTRRKIDTATGIANVKIDIDTEIVRIMRMISGWM